jgi:hypothetical protein
MPKKPPEIDTRSRQKKKSINKIQNRTTYAAGKNKSQAKATAGQTNVECKDKVRHAIRKRGK